MIDVLATGIALGVVYGLVGAAVATVASATRTLHLAVGAILVTGVVAREALVAAGAPEALALPAALLLGGALSAALEPLVLRPLRGALPRLVGLAVAAAVIEGATARTFGSRTLAPDPVLPGAAPVTTAILLGVPLVLLLALAVHRTRWGRQLRLVGGSAAAAVRGGIHPGRIRSSSLAVAGVVAILAGVLVAPIVFVGAGQGAGLTLRAVAAALLFGRRAPLWAVPGGLALGLVEAVVLRFGAGPWPAVAVAFLVVGVLAARGHDEDRSWGRAW